MENKIYTKAEEDRMMDTLLKAIEREEREMVIDYYITIIFLSGIMLGLGYIVGRMGL